MMTKNQQVYPLEDFGMVVGGTAHDLNNLLAGAQLQAALAIRKLPSDDPAATHISKVIEAMEHMTLFVDNLMSHSQGGQTKTYVDINGLIIKCVSISRLIIGEDVQIEYNLSPELPPIHVDKIQVQQLMLNLILNAAESLSSDLPEIIISSGYISAQNKNTDSGWWVAGDKNCPMEAVSFEIKDAGSGISREILRRVFDPFYSTKENGRGLGLPLVLEVVRIHSGRLLVKSVQGEGTLFKVFFPVGQADYSTRPTGWNGWVQ